ncbi:tyrosine-type recombinase/integrase [Nocardia sp. NPDC051052]|uniref:tyrosine-type recombinase/integrase n=1 Tax=Nocardia sp. NPDC051052 TaxID=3364322 RepID=UPI0037A857A3
MPPRRSSRTTNRRPRDEELCCVRLRQKGETVHWLPVSPTLMRGLTQLVTQRAPTDANGTAPVFRYRDGRPVTGRHYDHIWDRIGRYLPWVNRQQITAHWLRHTTLTWLERNLGFAIAHAFAGHADISSRVGATITYIRPTLQELAQAIAAMTGESHPLATAECSHEPS